MIYDNYDNPRLVSNKDPAAVNIIKFLPEVYQGLVLITIRSSEVEISHLIQVTKLGDLCKSLMILSNVSRREGLMDSKPVTNRRLIASDSSIEGNRRDYNMSGNQTSGKEGGV